MEENIQENIQEIINPVENNDIVEDEEYPEGVDIELNRQFDHFVDNWRIIMDEYWANQPILTVESANNDTNDVTYDINLDELSVERNNIQNCLIHISTDLDVKCDKSSETACHICYTNKISMSTVPCGHLLCISCAKYIYKNKTNCHECRQELNSIIRIFGL